MNVNNNLIQIKNYIERNLPTLNAAINSHGLKKVAFIFFSVITVGIVPLFLALYDIGNNWIQTRNQSRFAVFKQSATNFFKYHKTSILVGTIALAFILKIQFKIDLITPVSDAFFRNLSSLVKKYPRQVLGSLGIITGACLLKQAIEQNSLEKPKKKRSLVKRIFNPTPKSAYEQPLDERPPPYAPHHYETPRSLDSSPRNLNPLPEGVPQSNGYDRAYPVLPPRRQ